MIRAAILAALPLATSPALASGRIAQQPGGSIGVIDPQGGVPPSLLSRDGFP
jgi:hypothetical protein